MPSNPTLAYSYAYDRFGNRWNQTLTKGTGWPMSLTFNGSNQITTAGYRYDAAGNVVMDNVNCYTYDAENRLSKGSADLLFRSAATVFGRLLVAPRLPLG